MAGDHSEFSGFVRRILRAYSRRCADADPEDLVELLALQVEVTNAINAAVAGLREQGCSWAEIARATGTSRQAAHKRWGVNPGMTLESR
jgi:hypothetical protein